MTKNCKYWVVTIQQKAKTVIPDKLLFSCCNFCVVSAETSTKEEPKQQIIKKHLKNTLKHKPVKWDFVLLS